uniref:Uncharacterized protein n=1 Tax=Tanacetum cinerariifolium TaxID=118510 RepID=A0A6L2NM49_TANCI|nr:hypothetical protein [Tanacetum cinerariifolium]
MWKKNNNVPPLPPIHRKMYGKPRSRRIRHPTERDHHVSRSGRPITCQNCSERSHNRGSCKYLQRQKPPMKMKLGGSSVPSKATKGGNGVGSSPLKATNGCKGVGSVPTKAKKGVQGNRSGPSKFKNQMQLKHHMKFKHLKVFNDGRFILRTEGCKLENEEGVMLYFDEKKLGRS